MSDVGIFCTDSITTLLFTHRREGSIKDEEMCGLHKSCQHSRSLSLLFRFSDKSQAYFCLITFAKTKTKPVHCYTQCLTLSAEVNRCRSPKNEGPVIIYSCAGIFLWNAEVNILKNSYATQKNHR